MSDMGYFACLGVTVASAITAVAAAHSVIRDTGTRRAPIALGVSACVGVICALPFGATQEMPWLPVVAAPFFGAIVLGTILCCLCEIREEMKLLRTGRSDPSS